jgi:hypothetical protein
MKNAVYWVVTPRGSCENRRFGGTIASIINVTRIGEIGTALVVKNAIFWDVTPCGSCKNRRFGRTWRLQHQGDKIQRTRNKVSRN